MRFQGFTMRLLASTDYALRVLMTLAQSGSGETITVETLATSLGGLSRNHLHKIVQDLAAIGIVKTIRRAGGGVVLAKRPRGIRIGAVVRALEEDQAIVECFRADHCSRALEPGCRLRPMLRKGRRQFYVSLDSHTLVVTAVAKWLATRPGRALSRWPVLLVNAATRLWAAHSEINGLQSSRVGLNTSRIRYPSPT